MRSTLLAGIVAVLAIGTAGGCSVPSSDPAVGAAREAYCAGLYVTHVAPRSGTIFYVSPQTLAQATDGWGPQTLSVSVDNGFSPQITYNASPSLSKQKNNITKSVQQAMGFSLTASVNLTATSLVLVPTDAYYRLEAYPEYQVFDWELHADTCNFLPDTLVTRGSAFRPVGIHFRVLVYVGGEWNALAPPSPAELLLPPPWASGGAQAANNGGTGGAGGAPSAPPGSPGGAGAATAEEESEGGTDAGTGGDGG